MIITCKINLWPLNIHSPSATNFIIWGRWISFFSNLWDCWWNCLCWWWRVVMNNRALKTHVASDENLVVAITSIYTIGAITMIDYFIVTTVFISATVSLLLLISTTVCSSLPSTAVSTTKFFSPMWLHVLSPLISSNTLIFFHCEWPKFDRRRWIIFVYYGLFYYMHI